MNRSAIDYERVIGLEIHVQLRTSSKMFCGCRVEFGAPPNTHVCPVCLGLPGALPVVNRRAIALAIRAALALGSRVNPLSVFARKHYFYPDLPKGYQITQYDRPLAQEGSLDLPEAGGRVRIRRLHVEEDAGKSLHDRFAEETAVDLNRAGVPLIEIVTEPDLRSAAAARVFLGRLKQTLEYLEVSDCNMEEGSLRVDANVSVRPAGAREYAGKTEVKNMNSFSQLEKALEYEAERHIAILGSGGSVEHQTMLWDATRGEARPMRGKEEAHDYRYFSEPDLPPLAVGVEDVAGIAKKLPELPWQKTERFVAAYGLPEYDAGLLSATRELADYFEAVVDAGAEAKLASNWLMGEVLAACNERGVGIGGLGVEPARLAELIGLLEGGSLSLGVGKQVFRRMVETGKRAAEVVREEGLRTVSDAGQLEVWVAEALAESPHEVERYRAGEEKLLAHFIGQVMRKSGGRAEPGRLREILVRALRG